MLNRKVYFLFILKLAIIFICLDYFAPKLIVVYQNFYHSIASKFFSEFGENGFAQFNETDNAFNSELRIGNKSNLDENNRTKMMIAPFNIKYSGYLPTILLISLVLATPLNFRRLILTLFLGYTLITAIILIKTWIHIIYLCKFNSWLNLTEYSQIKNSTIESIYLNFVQYGGPSLIFAIIIWILVTFRKSDFVNK